MAAAVTTSNRVYAAPVEWTRQAVADHQLSAVALNSGGANACTGEAGYTDTVATAHLVAAQLEVTPADVAIWLHRPHRRTAGYGCDPARGEPGMFTQLSEDGGQNAALAI